jgi:hypothetical protein
MIDISIAASKAKAFDLFDPKSVEASTRSVALAIRRRL